MTFIYHHILDGSYTPFITPIASHPNASIITIKEEDPSDEELSLLLRYPSSEPDSSSDSSISIPCVAPLVKCRTDPTLRCICKHLLGASGERIYPVCLLKPGAIGFTTALTSLTLTNLFVFDYCERSKEVDKYFTYLNNPIRVTEPNSTYHETLPSDTPNPPYGVWDPDHHVWCTFITPSRAVLQDIDNSYPIYCDRTWRYISPSGERVPTTRDASSPPHTPPHTSRTVTPKLSDLSPVQPLLSMATRTTTQTRVRTDTMSQQDDQEVNNNLGDAGARTQKPYRPGDSRRIRSKAKEGDGGGDNDPSDDDGGGDNNSSGHFTFNSSMPNHTHRTFTGDNPAEFKENKHVAKPPFFDGSNWDEFWSAVLGVIRANPKYFQLYRRRIEYILFFFRGDVISWKQNYQSNPDNTVRNEYLDYPYNPDTDQLELPQEKHRNEVTEADWFRFMRLLKRDYETLDSRGQARQKIMYSKQGVLTAAEFFHKLDSSRRIARWQGKQHDEMVVEKLKENLNSRIVDAIYGKEKMPATYDDWKQAAMGWDNREQTKKLARAYGYRPTSPAQVWYRPSSPNLSYSPSTPHPPRPPTPRPSSNPPVLSLYR
ncbi:uncharacterized protein STEHIDRAFT_106638 [Stereum hirsutum FP-91666 SS1]|uniref:uncharacterized protein n=1 Tax=Stereum hirsutum (strain FP-91666) TaxID=721885 RepID=UPI000440CBB2|nr:uncharacterized protein STEHIDRAFT_106638 [Stereum hirsutum FP-91666 SS1]EIM91980.1 hypothetical protein STEHIDRAFT_106638 [Stereum hirsutum FP-91666 SS1]